MIDPVEDIVPLAGQGGIVEDLVVSTDLVDRVDSRASLDEVVEGGARQRVIAVAGRERHRAEREGTGVERVVAGSADKVGLFDRHQGVCAMPE